MPTIVQAMKENILHLSYGNRHVVWSRREKLWEVYEGEWGAAKLVASTKDQKTAVDFLLGKR